MSYALLCAIRDAEARGDHKRAQRLRDGLKAQQAARQPEPPDEPPPAAPAVPIAASAPLSRAETITQLCRLYGQDKHADYLIASGSDPAQAAATLAMLGAPGKKRG